jgi:hypothetical protein
VRQVKSCKRVFENIQLTPFIAGSFWGSSLLKRLKIIYSKDKKNLNLNLKTRDLALGQEDIDHG